MCARDPKRGRRTLVLPDDLRAWIEQLPAIGMKREDSAYTLRAPR
jgi:hypothetical protein